MRKHLPKYHIGNIYNKFRGIPRPKNVMIQFDRYYKEQDQEKKKIIYELILLERKIAGF